MSDAVEPATLDTPTVPAWVYRLDVEAPARHDGWRRAIRILRVRRPATGPRRRR